MQALVTFVSTNRRRQPQRDERRIPGTQLEIGRSSRNQVQLPDARVGLTHVRVSLTEDGPTLEALHPDTQVNGHKVGRAVLSIGDVIEIGPYRVTVEAPIEGVYVALVIHALVESGLGLHTLRRAISRAPRLSKRRLSYIAFFGTLLLTLVVPLAGDWMASARDGMSDGAAFHAVMPVVGNRFLQAWSPGALSRSHQVFGSDCKACHQFAFLQVRDSACVACHTTIREHVPRADLTGPLGVSFAKMRCAECHRDHKETRMAPRAQEECAACHVNIKNAAPRALSDNVTDFSVDHPEFRLSFIDASSTPSLMHRVRLSTPRAPEMVERSNLKFDHALHMNPSGIRDPANRYTVLKCSTCHKPDEGGRVMRPISMERDCQQCHSLAFEPKVTQRQVPHGSAEGAATMLREFYARLVLGDVPPGVTPPPDLPRMRPGEEVSYQERQEALRIADERAQRVLRELFETRDVCSTCHYVRRDNAEGWKVAPVRLTRVWMPQAQFSHAKHATESCTLCHDNEKSRDAADISMPAVQVCRECHVGARPVLGKVTSDCAACHKFHAGRNFWHDALQAPKQSATTDPTKKK